MTRFSRILTIFVTVLAIAFMGVAMVATATWTNWRDIALNKFPSAEISKQKETLARLQKEAEATDKEQQLAVAAIDADVKAISDPETGREAVLEKSVLSALEEQTRRVAQEVEAQARKADAKLGELKLRREDIARLQSQFDELVSQRQASQADVKRLEDLLFQAKAMLERVERRREWLESELKPSYEDGKKT